VRQKIVGHPSKLTAEGYVSEWKKFINLGA